MSHLENEILKKVMYLDREQKSKVLDYLRGLNENRGQQKRRRKALRQIRQAIENPL